VICSYCIRENNWKTPLNEYDNCPICGNYRTIAFSTTPFHETVVDRKVISSNPMKSFIMWMLYDFSRVSPQRDYENIVLAHNGVRKKLFFVFYFICQGRFDHVLLFAEMIKIGGIYPEIIAQGNKFYEITIRAHDVTTCYLRDTFVVR
jgi:hypothetical protein